MTLHKFLTILTILFTMGCGQRSNIVRGEAYEILVDYTDDYPVERIESLEDKLDDNTLYLFFETEFLSDTISIRINNESKELTKVLTTDPSMGLATTVELENLRKIYKIRIVKNNGKPLTLELNDKTMNKWGIMFYSDTLRANRYENARMYY